MRFCGVLSLSQVTSSTLVCIGPVSVGPIGLGPTQQEHRSGPVGPSTPFHQSVSVRSESKRQSVRFGQSKLDNLGPTGLDQDRTETEVVHPCFRHPLPLNILPPVFTSPLWSQRSWEYCRKVSRWILWTWNVENPWIIEHPDRQSFEKSGEIIQF